MAEPPRPTAEELEELALIVRRDPSSPAFVDLAGAYLALGRPREAIETAQAGLRGAPANHEGRLALARGHAALHQWKEAQAELLKVVKEDRANRAGFTLLGEVLMRRADYERAVPVLQHAQNLDPGSPAVLSLLRIARSGQPLDAPPPIPTPIAPRRSERRPAMPAPVAAAPPPRAPAPPAPPPRPGPPGPPPRPSAAMAAPPPPPPPSSFVDDSPTAVGSDPQFAPHGHAPQPHGGHAGAPYGGGYAIASQGPSRDDATIPSLPPEPVAGYQAAQAARPAPPSPPAPPAPPRAQRPSAGPPPGEPVRPRVLAAAKPVNAAAASLRQSAAVGENYLNDLLTGGLLDVPGVRVPDAEYDLRPDRRWGRSTVRAFIVLFVLLVAGVGGGGYWYYFTEQQRAADVARYQREAATLVADGDYDGLTKALEILAKAVDRDKKNTRTFAAVAETSALRTLLYGTPDTGTDAALTAAARSITKPTQEGYRALVIARTASALARLTGPGTEAPNQGNIDTLTKARAEIDEWLAAHPDDRWARFLAARGHLAAGSRGAAIEALRAAGDGEGGLVVALIERADLLVDDGNTAEAIQLYDAALARAKDHPLALVGRALARAESGLGTDEAISDLNVKLDKDRGARVNAYRQLALALSYYGLEEHQRFGDALAKATGPREPRFLARVALARVLQGHLAEAKTALGQIAWFTTGKADPDPLVTLVNGAVQQANGLPETALDTLGKLDGTRAELLRGLAQFDLGKYKEAQDELDAAQARAADSVEVKVWRLMATTVAATGAARDEAAAELEKTSRKSKSKIGRHAHGLAMLLTGNLDEARRRLGQALENISDVEPNPVAYRTRVALASIERQAGNLEAANTHLVEALKLNDDYLPARIELAKVLAAGGDGDAAGAMLQPVFEKDELVTGDVELLAAEAMMKRDTSKLRDKEKAAIAAEARAALERAKTKGAPAAELARVAALIGPDVAAQLGLVEEAPAAPAPPPRRAPPRRRGRGR